jgi:hypothetical protein
MFKTIPGGSLVDLLFKVTEVKGKQMTLSGLIPLLSDVYFSYLIGRCIYVVYIHVKFSLIGLQIWLPGSHLGKKPVLGGQ